MAGHFALSTLIGLLVSTSLAQVTSERDYALINDLALGQRPAAARNESLRAFVGVELDELMRVASLTKPQRLALETAAAGAVEATLEAWAEQMDHGGFPAPAPGDKFSPQQGPRRTSAASHPIWQNAIPALLTKQQYQLLEVARQQRSSFRAQAEAQMIVATFDRELLLSPAQRLATFAIVSREVPQSIRWAPDQIELTGDVAAKLSHTFTQAQQKKWDELQQQFHDGPVQIVIN